MKGNYLYSELTGKIIRAFYNVYNTLGYGFLEKVYKRAMVIELTEMGLLSEPQKIMKVYYKDQEVGEYFADILVEEKVIVELKATESLCPDHEAQLVNYLRSTNLEVGLLLNFGKKPQHKRRVLSEAYKKGNHNPS